MAKTNVAQNKNSPPRATLRFLTAYTTTFVVLGSYFWLNIRSRFFGDHHKEEKLGALHRKNARRIEQTILRLQGLFIKVGQLFSIMTNFLPEEFRSGLENLQDSVPERPYHQIQQRIIEELGDDPLKVFQSFDKTPLASASLGQVHKAMTKDGRMVAVKVQHIGVEAMAHADLKTIWRILGIIKRFFRTRGIDNYYYEIKAMILDELDFEKEALNITRIAKNFEGNEKVIFPNVLSELSTRRLLTMDYAEGVKITEVEKLRQMKLDPHEVAKDLVTLYCQMIFMDGVYHADPHPGNVLVQEDGSIVLLDFGAVGHLSDNMRNGISSFLEAIIRGDEDQLLRSLQEMGFLRIGTHQSEAATRIIEHFHRKLQEEIKLKSFSLSSFQIDTSKGLEQLADLRKMNIGIREVSSAFHMPREWVLLERAALLLTGLCTHLDSQMNPTDIIRPYLEEFVLGKDRDWSEMLFDVTREKLFSFLSLPSLFEKVVNKSLAGNLSFKVTGIGSAADLIYIAAHQLIYTFLASVSAGVGIYFHHIQDTELTKYATYASGSFIVILLLSMFKAKKYRRR